MLEPGKSVRKKLLQTQDVVNSSKIPFTITLCRSGKAGTEIRSEVEPGMKRKVGGKCFKALFYFSLPYFDLIE